MGAASGDHPDNISPRIAAGVKILIIHIGAPQRGGQGVEDIGACRQQVALRRAIAVIAACRALVDRQSGEKILVRIDRRRGIGCLHLLDQGRDARVRRGGGRCGARQDKAEGGNCEEPQA